VGRQVHCRKDADGAVVVMPGFQGMTRQHEITTLDRGSSDTSANAIAAPLEAAGEMQDPKDRSGR